MVAAVVIAALKRLNENKKSESYLNKWDPAAARRPNPMLGKAS